MWLQEKPSEDLEPLPADMVMASASGLDPHITLSNARYQLDRVAAAWADKTKISEPRVRKAIEDLLNEKAHAPFGAVFGEAIGPRLINVLEVNLALSERMTGLGGG
jgi:K+-transporting ATPase ATPase C chain